MISIKFSYYGHGTLICLCDDCKKKLMEVLNGEKLPPVNNSEIPNSSDMISRSKAIEALKNDMASLDHIIKGMSANDVRLDAYVSQRNQVNYDIYTINNLPPVQPEQLGTNLASLSTDCISRQQAIDDIWTVSPLARLDRKWVDRWLRQLPSAQPEQTGCEYCHEDSDGYVMPLEKSCHAFIRYGMNGWELSLKAKGWHGSAKIKYCPICGRSLTHE